MNIRLDFKIHCYPLQYFSSHIEKKFCVSADRNKKAFQKKEAKDMNMLFTGID